MRHRWMTLGAVTFVFLAVPFPRAYAGYEYKLDERVLKTGYYESDAAAKLSRGVTNTLYGWTELVRTPNRLAADPRTSALYAGVVGVPYGVFRFVGRTLVGVYEMATCFAPQPPIFSDIDLADYDKS